MSATLTTARQAVEHLARAIAHHDLDGRAPDELACGCASDLVKLLESFDQEGILFERLTHERVPCLLRKIHIRAALRMASRELELVRGVLA